MSFDYKNPLSSSQLTGTQSVARTSTFGTNFSVLNVGGYMEVYNLIDLELTLTAATYPSNIQLSANTIPINFTKGTGTSFSPDSISLYSDNISSGRRKLGMQVYVQETDTVYQYTILDYENLWNALSGLTGNSAKTVTDYSTVVNSRSQAGKDFINAWTGSTIEGYNEIRENARWRIFSGLDIQITGGTYFSGTSDLDLYNSTGGTITITGLTAPITGGTYNSGSETLTLTNSLGEDIQVTGFTSGGGGSPLSVGDGITTVSNVTGMTFSGASVVNNGDGNITINITGGT